MNVKNIDDFIADIDETQTMDYVLQTDCHEKIKKLVLIKEWILQEETFEETVQITLENNPSYINSPRRTYSDHPSEYPKRWETPGIESNGYMERQKRKYIPEKTLKKISDELDHPIFDGANYYKDGERL